MDGKDAETMLLAGRSADGFATIDGSGACAFFPLLVAPFRGRRGEPGVCRRRCNAAAEPGLTREEYEEVCREDAGCYAFSVGGIAQMSSLNGKGSAASVPCFCGKS